MIGKHLSHYLIEAELGRGGMGIVYRAKDTKLDRTVAIKVLPSAALASEDDRARFYREAKAAAALTHPHIAIIHAVDEAVPEDAPHGTEPSPFIAMEFIDGKTLEGRIATGPLKLDEAVRIASEIASALKLAHENEIVHRDIKSANVMLTKDGAAKVLDFGLAQTAASTKLTRMGSTLGTVAYMSPEQARGEPVDCRTDIWSLGAVLYEMVSGRPAFPGEYEQALVYSILNQDPEPLTALRTGVPMELERIVAKCLRKDAGLRYQSTAELKVDLEAVEPELSNPNVSGLRSAAGSTLVRTGSLRSDSLQSNSPHTEPAAKQPSRTTLQPIVLVAAIAVSMVAGALGMWIWGGTSDTAPAATNSRTSIILPDEYPLALIGSSPYFTGRKSFDLSDDGKWLVYDVEMPDGGTLLGVRAMDSDEVSILAGTNGAFSPFFSPDASSIGFFADDQLKIIEREGGSPRSLTDVRIPLDGFWHESGYIIYSDRETGPIVRVSPDDGMRTVLKGGGYNANPAPVPGTDYLVAIVDEVLALVTITSGETISTPIGGDMNEISSPSYAEPGYILYTQGTTLTAIRFDKETLEFSGRPFPVLSGVRQEALAFVGQYDHSWNGTLIIIPGGDSRLSRLVKTTFDGKVQELPFEPQLFGEMRISPDRSRLAICVYTSKWNIWVYDLVGNREPERLTFEGNNYNPAWSPDGETIYFSSDRTGEWRIFKRSAVTSGTVEQLDINPEERVPGGYMRPYDISRDGKHVLIGYSIPEFGDVIESISFDSATTPFRIGLPDISDWGAKLSPDAQYVAFNTDEPGPLSVYMTRHEPDAPRIRLSSLPGMDPLWSDDGRYVYFHNVRQIYRTRIPDDAASGRFDQELVTTGDFVDLAGIGWAMDDANGIFYMAQSTDREKTTLRLDVFSNLPALLAEKDPASGRVE